MTRVRRRSRFATPKAVIFNAQRLLEAVRLRTNEKNLCLLFEQTLRCGKSGRARAITEKFGFDQVAGSAKRGYRQIRYARGQILMDSRGRKVFADYWRIPAE